MATVIATSVLAGVLAYLAGSIPWAYIITKHATGKDITRSGSGNVGAMNVRRVTGSWGWFVVTVIADMSKGFIPVAVTRLFLAARPCACRAENCRSSSCSPSRLLLWEPYSATATLCISP